MTRTRSEYRLSPIAIGRPARPLVARHPVDDDRDPLATLMLDAYRHTVDDEGEDLEDARVAIDEYLRSILRGHSYVVIENDGPVAFSFVVVVDALPYIDPVVVAPTHQRRGLGEAVARHSLASLADVGESEVGAVITDGNVASAQLFTRLGFVRHGPWS